MASPQGYDKLFTQQKIQMFDVDADYTTAAVITASMEDMRDYEGYAAVLMASIATTGPTKVELIASSDSAGTTDIIVIKDSGTVAADAVGDYVALECSASEIAQEAADNGSTARYCGVRLTSGNSGDESVLTTILYGASYPQDGLTATTIA